MTQIAEAIMFALLVTLALLAIVAVTLPWWGPVIDSFFEPITKWCDYIDRKRGRK